MSGSDPSDEETAVDQAKFPTWRSSYSPWPEAQLCTLWGQQDHREELVGKKLESEGELDGGLSAKVTSARTLEWNEGLSHGTS